MFFSNSPNMNTENYTKESFTRHLSHTKPNSHNVAFLLKITPETDEYFRKDVAENTRSERFQFQASSLFFPTR